MVGLHKLVCLDVLLTLGLVGLVACGDDSTSGGGTDSDTDTDTDGTGSGSATDSGTVSATSTTGTGTSGTGTSGTATATDSTGPTTSGSGDTGTGDTGTSSVTGSTSGGSTSGGSTGGTTGGVMNCGNGVLEGTEQCDDGNSNSDLVADACRTDCTDPSCGDAVVDYGGGEQCDDGNPNSNDGCSAACAVEVTNNCGDGTLSPANGEECDDGNTTPGDGCAANCQLELVGASCGDGTQQSGEECDDNNTANGDACNPTCNLDNTTTLFVGSPGNQGSQDGAGNAARLGGWGAIVADNTYIWYADSANRIVRRIQISNANVLTIAGDGTTGDMDNATGLNAKFGGLEAIATDGSTVWIADGGNRKLKSISVTPPHAVTTVAGSGAQAVTDGIGGAAAFNDLRGLTYYNGLVYLLDANGAVLRSFDPATNAVVTLAGQVNNPGVMDGVGTAAQFISPRYMVSDNSGNLFIADTNGYHIRSYNVAQNYVGTFAGSGAAGYVDGVGAAASIHRPRGMGSDGTSIYFVEFNQHTVRQGVIATQSVTTLAGQHCNGGANCNGGYTEGVGTAAQFDGPFGLTFHYPSNSLFLLDSANFVIRRIQ